MRIASLIPVFALIATLTLVATKAEAQLAFLVINELDCDTPGANASALNDNQEFIELYDGGVGNQSLVGYCLVFYNGSTGSPCATGTLSYFAVDLTGSTDVNGYYVIGSSTLTATAQQTWTHVTNGVLQNGADAVGLYFAAAAAYPTGTAVTAVNLVDAVAYDTSDFPACAIIAALTPGQPSVNENANAMSSTESIGRCPNGQGGPFTTTGWQARPPTPGATNACVNNVFAISITQPGGCGGLLTISVVNAASNAELFNLISLLCSVPAGGGPLFGLAVGPGSGDPLQEAYAPIGSHPFHVNADINGNYSISFGTSPCPGIPFQVEGVSLQVIGYSVQAISQTTTCVHITI